MQIMAEALGLALPGTALMPATSPDLLAFAREAGRQAVRLAKMEHMRPSDIVTLYIVATPIGNLDDMPPRVAATFGAADFIAAEDTRVTMKLLNFLGLKKPMVSYYEHALQKGEGILRRIEEGENCALCSDAGMPCVSDPGEVIGCARNG